MTKQITFSKPEGDGIMHSVTVQDVFVNGELAATIECEWIVDYDTPCSRKQVRKGTECYIVRFEGEHPLYDCDFSFDVQWADAGKRVTNTAGTYRVPSKKSRANDTHLNYSVVYPDARKALAAAKRFCKAVL